jgi:hypothetical protein
MTDLGGERDLRERMVAMTVRVGEGLGRDGQACYEILAISVQTSRCVKRMIRIFSWRTRHNGGKTREEE